MRCLGADPGETTGLFLLDINFNRFEYRAVHKESLVELYNALHSIRPDIIVCEGFDRRMKAGNIVPIIKSIAVVDLFSQQTNTPVEMQSASYGKAFWDNDKLKRVGAYSPKMKHANDAARHVLQYLSNKGNDKRFIMMLKPEDFVA